MLDPAPPPPPSHLNHVNGSATPSNAILSPTLAPAPGAVNGARQPLSILDKLSKANEDAWLVVGEHAFPRNFPHFTFFVLCEYKYSSADLHAITSYHTGRVAEQMGNLDSALSAYDNVLRHNPRSLPGLTQMAGIARIKENYALVRSAFLSPRAHSKVYSFELNDSLSHRLLNTSKE
jgi:general transcriptional corepressor CYC8